MVTTPGCDVRHRRDAAAPAIPRRRTERRIGRRNAPRPRDRTLRTTSRAALRCGGTMARRGLCSALCALSEPGGAGPLAPRGGGRSTAPGQGHARRRECARRDPAGIVVSVSRRTGITTKDYVRRDKRAQRGVTRALRAPGARPDAPDRRADRRRQRYIALNASRARAPGHSSASDRALSGLSTVPR